MTHMEKSDYITRARASKASRLASWSRKGRPSGRGYTLDEMEPWTDDQWLMAAVLAGVAGKRNDRTPSRETQRMALDVRAILDAVAPLNADGYAEHPTERSVCHD